MTAWIYDPDEDCSSPSDEAPTVERVPVGSCPRPLRVSLHVAMAVANIVSVAHREGVLHGDLRISDIALLKNGLVEVGGFGRASRTRARAGRPLSTATDAWGVGAITLELLTGSPPTSDPETDDQALVDLRIPGLSSEALRHLQRILVEALDAHADARPSAVDIWRLIGEAYDHAAGPDLRAWQKAGSPPEWLEDARLQPMVTNVQGFATTAALRKATHQPAPTTWTRRAREEPAGDAPRSQAVPTTPTTPGVRSYRIEKRLGQGGFGTVYLATFISTAGGFEKPVALKRLNADLPPEVADEAERRLRDEAKILSHISHGAVVRVQDLVYLDGRWTIVMEYVDGAGLDEVGAMPVGLAFRVAEEVAGALHSAYTSPLQLLHRDIKPANIRIARDGTVRVLDFGVARVDPAIPREGQLSKAMVWGSPNYMAPERWDGIDSHAGDVYALGVTLLEVITKRTYDRTSSNHARHDTYLERAREGLTAANVPSEASDIVLGCLAFDPEQRPTAGVLERRLREAREKLPKLELKSLVSTRPKRVDSASAPDPLIGTTLVETKPPRLPTPEGERPPHENARPGTTGEVRRPDSPKGRPRPDDADRTSNPTPDPPPLTPPPPVGNPTAPPPQPVNVVPEGEGKGMAKTESAGSRPRTAVLAWAAGAAVAIAVGVIGSATALAGWWATRPAPNPTCEDCTLGVPQRLLADAPGIVSAVAYSGDGRWLAAASDDGAVRLYRADDLRLERTVALGQPRDEIPVGLAFSSDRLLVVGLKGSLWALAPGPLAEPNLVGTLPSEDGGSADFRHSRVAVTPDDDVVVVSRGRSCGGFDLATLAPAQLSDDTRTLCDEELLSADGRWSWSGSSPSVGSSSADSLFRLQPGGASPNAVAFDPVRPRLAAATDVGVFVTDLRPEIWHPTAPALAGNVAVDGTGARVAFTLRTVDGHRVALVDLANGETTWASVPGGLRWFYGNALSFTEDDHVVLATGDGTAWWPVDRFEGSPAQLLNKGPPFAARGSTFADLNARGPESFISIEHLESDGGEVVEAGRVPVELPADACKRYADLRASGGSSWLWVCDEGVVVGHPSWAGWLPLGDRTMADGADRPAASITSAALSMNDRFVALGTENGKVHLLDLNSIAGKRADGKVVPWGAAGAAPAWSVIEAGDGAVTALAFDGTSSALVAGVGDPPGDLRPIVRSSQVVRFDVATGRVTARLAGTAHEITGVAAWSSGRIVVAGNTKDGMGHSAVAIVETLGPTDERTILYREPFVARPTVLDVSSDGRVLAVGDATGGVALWDLEANALMSKQTAEQGDVVLLSFSPKDPTLLATATAWNLTFWRLGDGTLTKESSWELAPSYAPFPTEYVARDETVVYLRDPIDTIREGEPTGEGDRKIPAGTQVNLVDPTTGLLPISVQISLADGSVGHVWARDLQPRLPRVSAESLDDPWLSDGITLALPGPDGDWEFSAGSSMPKRKIHGPFTRVGQGRSVWRDRSGRMLLCIEDEPCERWASLVGDWSYFVDDDVSVLERRYNLLYYGTGFKDRWNPFSETVEPTWYPVGVFLDLEAALSSALPSKDIGQGGGPYRSKFGEPSLPSHVRYVPTLPDGRYNATNGERVAFVARQAAVLTAMSNPIDRTGLAVQTPFSESQFIDVAFVPDDTVVAADVAGPVTVFNGRTGEARATLWSWSDGAWLVSGGAHLVGNASRDRLAAHRVLPP